MWRTSRVCNRCMKSVRIRSFFGPHFPAFGLNMDRYYVSLRIQSECGKNSEYRHFLSSEGCALSKCCTFSNHFIWIKTWSLFSAFTTITLKKLFQVLWSCSIMLFVLIYVKEWKNMKVQRNIQLLRNCAHAALFETC